MAKYYKSMLNMELKQYAIKAFSEGTDNFGERITGETSELMYDDLGQKYFHMTVFLLEGKDWSHHSTSGIGFYPNAEWTELRVCSGHMLPWTIEITPEIRKMMDQAIEDHKNEMEA
jgi:hypothetical protein